MIYFDELSVGDRFLTPARTVTEADIVTFAGLTGDFNDNHMNIEAARKKFGERIAHGLLVLTLTRGLMFRAGLTGQESELAFLGIPEVSFKSPVMIGDTIRVECVVKELAEDPGHGGQGTALFDCDVINQKDMVVQHNAFRAVLGGKAAG